jgi:23S rRNA pseudouridine2605 synthase
MSLTEGKNREIRKLCGHFGWAVSRLIRISYGPFQLGNLEAGAVEEVKGKVLKDQLGIETPKGRPKERPKPARKPDADRRRKP